MMMKRLAAAGIVTGALGGVLLTGTPAMAGGGDNDEVVVNQEKVLELNVACNIAVLSIQKGANCGGSTANVDTD